MLTFSDLLTLLLTFFVLRISMASLDAEKVEDMLDAVQLADKVAQASVKESVASGIERELQQRFGEPERVKGTTNEKRFRSDIRLKPTPQGALLYLGGSTFESASDELTDEGRIAIRQIGRILAAKELTIDIAGHTDDIPIQTERFQSNWELSAARAIAVARDLISLGISPERISVVGYSDTLPVASNFDEEGRAKNRRIEIFLKQPRKAL